MARYVLIHSGGVGMAATPAQRPRTSAASLAEAVSECSTHPHIRRGAEVHAFETIDLDPPA
jgi:hypothetical protein